jgi:LacI family transcriptional regulator
MDSKSRSRFVQKVRPRIIVSLQDQGNEFLMERIVSIARKWDWDLLDYALLYGDFPHSPLPSGALVDSLGDSALVQQLYKMGCQVVRLGRQAHPFDRLVPAVIPDDHEAGRIAAQHFHERSFQNIAYLGWDPDDKDSNSHLLYKGFKQFAVGNGMHLDVYSMRDRHVKDESASVRFERLKNEIGEWLLALPKPVGLFSFNDLMAARACVICQRVGLSVPEEVAILGIGNTTWCDRAPVELSSIILNEFERARIAMRLLRKMTDGGVAPAEPILVSPRGIAQRKSTDLLAVTDLVTAKALSFIWMHFKDDISVQDVASSVSISSRQLERRFRKAIGRSVNEELRRKRLEVARYWLRNSDMPIADISVKVGFRSSTYFHRIFVQAHSRTPRKYRLGLS